jgi:hypothetical protein
VKFTDGYASNISKGVNLSTGKVTGLKSHDYHVWIERIMPVMVRGYVPERVWRVLAELSHFFRTLCAKEVCPEMIKEMHKKAPELICKLEKIFPPSFFTPMTHLILHLANKVLLGGLCRIVGSMVLKDKTSIFDTSVKTKLRLKLP